MNSEMNKKKPTKVSIVIPVYNGEESIGRLTDELVSALRELYNLEIVLVNDNSPDNSEAVCEGLFKKYPDIVCFYSLAKNVGEHNAVMAGLNQATGDYMVIMDDDFQNPITEVVKLVNYATENDCDVTYTYYKKKKHSFFRNLGSRFNDKVANVMLKKPKNLYLSSFKALSRFIVDEITKYDLPYPYIDGLILRTTDKIAKVEVKHHEREAGRSGYTMAKLVRLWLNMFTSFSILPLRVSTIMGMIFSLLGLGLGVFTVVEKLANPDLPIGYAATIVMISTFAGIQLLSLGVIGEYVGRIFMSFNKKPQYTIRKRFVPGKKEKKLRR
jgi:undecaprenyl-phosphate 4-deoxy-4-formamido-L-arabinose transferase